MLHYSIAVGTSTEGGLHFRGMTETGSSPDYERADVRNETEVHEGSSGFPVVLGPSTMFGRDRLIPPSTAKRMGRVTSG